MLKQGIAATQLLRQGDLDIVVKKLAALQGGDEVEEKEIVVVVVDMKDHDIPRTLDEQPAATTTTPPVQTSQAECGQAL